MAIRTWPLDPEHTAVGAETVVASECGMQTVVKFQATFFVNPLPEGQLGFQWLTCLCGRTRTVTLTNTGGVLSIWVGPEAPPRFRGLSRDQRRRRKWAWRDRDLVWEWPDD